MTKIMLRRAGHKLTTHPKLFTASVLLMLLSSFLLLASWLSHPANAKMMKTGVNTESVGPEGAKLKTSASGKQQGDGSELHLLAASY